MQEARARAPRVHVVDRGLAALYLEQDAGVAEPKDVVGAHGAFLSLEEADAFLREPELASEIEITLLHEIGEYYSLSDEELDRLGLE